jgi:hypothetical protein
MGARNQVGIGLSYRPARLHSLAELVPLNRFWRSLKVKKFGLCTTKTYIDGMNKSNVENGGIVVCNRNRKKSL